VLRPTARTVPTAVDLFAGAGGSTAGLKAAGFAVVGAIEADPDAVRSYRANHPEVHLVDSDIRKVDAAGFVRALHLGQTSVNILVACPPCQSFSTLGAPKSDDDRPGLVADVWRFARRMRPHVVILENVPGIRNRPELSLLIRRLRAVGYSVRGYTVDATEFGVPQRRKRHVVFAVNTLGTVAWPTPLLRALPASFDKTLRSAAETLQLVNASPRDGLSRHRIPNGTTLARIKAVPPGGDRRSLPDELQLACHARLGRSGATSSYGRIALSGPAPTMTTRCTTPACGRFVHPIQNRGLTLREAASLQTFPADYAFSGPYGSIERQIGNAVPVRMAEGLARIALGFLPPSARIEAGDRAS